jgi:hypothetical protein
MFNTEQRGLVVGFRRLSLTPVLIALLTAYAGLSTAVAGFVLDSTAMVVVGLVLVGSGRVLVNLITWAMSRPGSARLDVYERGEQCESLHQSLRPLTPSVKNSVSPNGPLSIRAVSTPSPTRLATISGSTSMSSGPDPKVLTAQPLPTGS